MQVSAPAKVNLSFKIRGRRDDGFHEIATLMAPVSLCDQLTIVEEGAGCGIDFRCDDASIPAGVDNLVVRAAELFFQRTGTPRGIRIELHKCIPHGAGLGGGSSDAAATLLALNQQFESPLRPNELLAIAAQIGSDVPFFLAQSPARCSGRGEIVTACRLPQPFRLLLAKPEFGVATPIAYARWKDSRPLPRVDYGPQEFGGVSFENDLERPVFEKYPFLARMKTWLRQQPEVGAALLSGSGSTVFAALRENADAAVLGQRMREALDPKLWVAEAETPG